MQEKIRNEEEEEIFIEYTSGRWPLQEINSLTSHLCNSDLTPVVFCDTLQHR